MPNEDDNLFLGLEAPFDAVPELRDLPRVPTEMEMVARTEGSLLCKYSTGGCESPAIKPACAVCGQPFCVSHASEVDPEFCSDCLKPVDTALTSNPLIDEDGVTHKGALLTPSGAAYKPMMQRIAEMTEDQLSAHIQHYKNLVHEAERVLDYRRITLSAAELQLGDLQAINRRRKAGTYKPSATGGSFSAGLGGAAPTPKSAARTLKNGEAKASKLAGVAKDLGIDPSRMAEFILALANASKGKK